MRARSIPSVELDSYQRAARLVLTHHLVTATFPDRSALATVRRWATELREDLLATFGYRLEVTETTMRVLMEMLDDPRTDELISDLLRENLEQIKQAVRDRDHERVPTAEPPGGIRPAP